MPISVTPSRSAASCTGCRSTPNRPAKPRCPPPMPCWRSAGEVEGFRGESFPAISGAGEHGAIIHYRVTEASNRPIQPNEVYLINSGAQYPDGTTDITRTVWTGPGHAAGRIRDRVTRVMQGHIALATTVFPKGVGGAHLDALARRALWQAGLDYDHGTGHGVGSYLSVHEGPVSISRLARPVAIAAGMILSNEPGFYLPDHYGIRLENLLLVQPADSAGRRKAVPVLRDPDAGAVRSAPASRDTDDVAGA